MKLSWKVWCKSLGDKINSDDRESDLACLIRSLYWFSMVITSIFIIIGVIRHF